MATTRLVLLSDPSPEFPFNSPFSFKVRLAEPLKFEGDWNVALLSLSVPNGGKTWRGQDKVAFKLGYSFPNTVSSSTPIRVETDILRSKMEEHVVRNGMDFVRVMNHLFEKEAFERAQEASTVVSDIWRPQFRMGDDEMILESRKLSDVQEGGISVKISKPVAIGMGWFDADKDSLGDNLYFTLPYDVTSSKYTAVKNTEMGGKDVFSMKEEFLQLSPTVEWHFVNINEAFAAFTGSPSRRFFVYSDLVESNQMSGQLYPLLREVYFSPQQKGSSYFEPVHLQWMPIRRSFVDIVEMDLADPTGNLAKLSHGQTICTVLFRKV